MRLATLTALLAGCAYASPAEDITTHTSILLPSGIPATGTLPFSPLSFDTTAASSLLSSLSALISSESVAASSAAQFTPPTTPSQQPTTSTIAVGTPSSTAPPSSTPTSSSTQTGSATRNKGGVVGSHVVVAGVALGGVIAALL